MSIPDLDSDYQPDLLPLMEEIKLEVYKTYRDADTWDDWHGRLDDHIEKLAADQWAYDDESLMRGRLKAIAATAIRGIQWIDERGQAA